MNHNEMNATEPAVETSVNHQATATSTMDTAREKLDELNTQAREKASELSDQAREKASEMSEQAREKLSGMSSQAKEKFSDMSAHAKERLLEAHSQAKERLAEKSSQLAEKADHKLHKAGERMHQFADSLREKSPNDGRLSQPLSKVADTLDTSADYLAQHGLSDIQADVTDLVRKYPVQALGAGLLLGFMLGATLSRR